MKQISYIPNFEEWKKEFSYYIPIKVRFSETDMFGHVNNVSTFIYFEEARTSFIEENKIFGELTGPIENVPVVSDLQCDYLKQMYFGQTIKLYCKVHQLGRSSMDIHYMATDENGDVCLTGRGRVVQINAKTGKSTPFSEEQLKVIEETKIN
ncbi:MULTISPECIES: acyl-CoA thioesterase [Allobacillus]|uniref:Acyl-CoA thioesterase n=1 Tax=Allobacillus halotolerans TaxID=570278 RepID=A0ABS6GND4_9BACI|nr:MULTISPECIES: thioesterase family protein [Allobacillus]MBU6080154.1 acyl-CoA thioesterase [Allobacillus halotolerans]TSJ68361.1 acyl-CoA thioesterase [Allobacillus sp. SKP2-8]